MTGSSLKSPRERFDEGVSDAADSRRRGRYRTRDQDREAFLDTNERIASEIVRLPVSVQDKIHAAVNAGVIPDETGLIGLGNLVQRQAILRLLEAHGSTTEPIKDFYGKFDLAQVDAVRSLLAGGKAHFSLQPGFLIDGDALLKLYDSKEISLKQFVRAIEDPDTYLKTVLKGA